MNYVELLESHSFDPTIFPRLRRLVREREIDIVHAHDYKTNVLAWLLSRFEAIIPLSTVHGWTGHSARERWLYYPIDKRVLAHVPGGNRGLERRPPRAGRARRAPGERSRRAQRDRSQSLPTRSLARGRGATRAGARRNRFRRGSGRKSRAAEAVRPAPGSLRRAEAQASTSKLIVAGAGSRLEELRDQARRLNLGEACQLLGNRTDIARLHHAFNLFVQSSDYEGTPNAVLEAMAFESPVVATSAGGTAEIVRHGIDGVIVPPGTGGRLPTPSSRCWANPTRHGPAPVRRDAGSRPILSFEARMNAVEAIYVELFQRRSGANATRLAAART